MTRYIQILQHQTGRHHYSMVLVDEMGEVRQQQDYQSKVDAINNIDFLLRLGYQIAETSQDIYQRLMS